MMKYEVGPVKATQNGAVDTLLWGQGDIPTGPEVKGVTIVQTGTAHDLDSIANFVMAVGNTEFVNFANDAQIVALYDSLGKKALATSAVRWTVMLQNTYGHPIQDPGCAAPAVGGDLSMTIVTDGTGSAVGTVTPIFHLDPEFPATSYPHWVSQQLASGTPSNATLKIDDEGALLCGFVYDSTNVTTLGFRYGGKDIIPNLTPTQILELQELWQGTTVTSPRAVWFPTPLPVLKGLTSFKITGSGAVGQILPLLKKPYAA